MFPSEKTHLVTGSFEPSVNKNSEMLHLVTGTHTSRYE